MAPKVSLHSYCKVIAAITNLLYIPYTGTCNCDIGHNVWVWEERYEAPADGEASYISVCPSDWKNSMDITKYGSVSGGTTWHVYIVSMLLVLSGSGLYHCRFSRNAPPLQVGTCMTFLMVKSSSNNLCSVPRRMPYKW